MFLDQQLHVTAYRTVKDVLPLENHSTDVSSHFPEWYELSQLGPPHDFGPLAQQHNSILTEQL